MNIATRNNFNLIYNGLYDIVNTGTYSRLLSIGAKVTYGVIYKWYKNTTHVHEDQHGEYISVARSVIAAEVGVSVKTVIKYIKELSRVKLIKDTRRGVHQTNKIAFYDVPEEFKYKYKAKEDKSNIDDSSHIIEPIVDEKSQGLISKVKETILDSFGEVVTTINAKQILIITNSNLDILENAIKYMAGKEYDNFMPKLTDTIRNRYWEKDKPTKTESKPNTKPPNKNKKLNNGRFTNISSHNWDMNKLEKLEDLYGRLSVGQITREEYNRLCSELDK